MRPTVTYVLLVLVIRLAPGLALAQEITVGSKVFTESVILGEMLTQLSEKAGTDVSHRKDLGGTQILWQALLRGEIDLYPEYTGTIGQEILGDPSITQKLDIRLALEKYGVHMSRPLGLIIPIL